MGATSWKERALSFFAACPCPAGIRALHKGGDARPQPNLGDPNSQKPLLMGRLHRLCAIIAVFVISFFSET